MLYADAHQKGFSLCFQVICDLMSSLKAGSVVEEGGLYSDLPVLMPIPPSEQDSVPHVEKINAVCESIRKALEQVDSDKYLNAIVMSHARYYFTVEILKMHMF